MSWITQNVAFPSLEGLRVLVVDDEPVIALEIEYVLTKAGAAVVGPVGVVAEALELVKDETLSAAVLDVRLAGESIDAVAEALCDHDVPFIFYSGQVETDATLYRWPRATYVAKPAPARRLVEAVRGIVDATSAPGRPDFPDRPATA